LVFRTGVAGTVVLVSNSSRGSGVVPLSLYYYKE
jgi:hypothetical protein